MSYCSQCGQPMPQPRFRIINGPAILLFIWPAFDLVAYSLLPCRPGEPRLHGALLAVGAVITVATYAWIALSGR